MVDSVVHMEPSKEFFIGILTKDIKIEKAIFDLIDNSIDAAKLISKDLTSYKIRLTLKNNLFKIEDNCGGISIERASKYAFKFGYDNSKEEVRENSIGHYRIGMKRAFFKLGNKIKVASATSLEFFSLILEVNKWRNAAEWSIPFRSKGKNNGSKEQGTKIEIVDLHEEVVEKFSENNYIKELREEVSKTYKDVIKKGITIIVNDIVVSTSRRANEEEICKCKIDNKNYIAEIVIKQEKLDYHESGWYIYLNDRLVVKADKTELSGWDIGNNETSFALRGYIYVTSKKEALLPFNTTKDGLDTSNPIYSELKAYMKKVLDEALPKISKGYYTSIKYDKPREEVERLKKVFKVRFAKEVGEKTYEDYLRNNNLD